MTTIVRLWPVYLLVLHINQLVQTYIKDAQQNALVKDRMHTKCNGRLRYKIQIWLLTWGRNYNYWGFEFKFLISSVPEINFSGSLIIWIQNYCKELTCICNSGTRNFIVKYPCQTLQSYYSEEGSTLLAMKQLNGDRPPMHEA